MGPFNCRSFHLRLLVLSFLWSRFALSWWRLPKEREKGEGTRKDSINERFAHLRFLGFLFPFYNRVSGIVSSWSKSETSQTLNGNEENQNSKTAKRRWSEAGMGKVSEANGQADPKRNENRRKGQRSLETNKRLLKPNDRAILERRERTKGERTLWNRSS